ncbi:MAG: hypothetical protein IH613_13610 [Desulfuromonadales bacterium]|nr:hypothetical protein [Desulfuromonadales bacterium]
MILHPGVLALLLGGLVSLLMLSAGALLGIRIARRWNPDGAEADQLSLERRAWLVAVLVRWAIVFEALSLLLFIYTAEVIHPLFVGAMCATGTLNANPIGWHLIWIKLLLFLLGGLWMVLNHLDLQCPEAPLTRFKFIALIPFLPLAIADLTLMVIYFAGLEPEVITSCCGALFSSGGDGLASELAALPLRPMMIVFYAGLAAYGCLVLLSLLSRRPWMHYLLALASGLFLVLGLTAIVSFISLYIYELPTHHCPFDMLQRSSNFVGYPIYLSLLGATICGLVQAMLEYLCRIPGLSVITSRAQRPWLLMTLFFWMLFALLTGWPVLFGPLAMTAYF